MTEVSTGAQDEDPIVRDVTQWLADNPTTPAPAGDLVERVARAMARSRYDHNDGPDVDGWVDFMWPEFVDDATAAIAAIPDRAALVDDGWGQVGYYKEKLRQANETIESFNGRLPEFMALRTQLADAQAEIARMRGYAKLVEDRLK